MQITRLIPAFAVVFLPVIACSDAASPAAPRNEPAPLPADTRPAVVQIYGQATILAGDGYAFSSRVTTANGALLPGTPIAFVTGDTSVAIIESVSAIGDGFRARIRGVGPGYTTITATALGRTTAAGVKVFAPASGPSSVVIEDFHVVAYGSPAGQWSPLLRMRDTAGNRGAAVIRVTFPSAAANNTLSCTMSRPVGAMPFELFPEIYGDYELTISGGDALVLVGGKMTVLVTVALDDSVATVLTATGPIVAGSPPSTNSGGTSDGMNCGFL